MGFGLSIVAPFGLKTSYGKSSPLRYAATLTSITVIDISPSIGFKISDKASLGVGLDIQRAYADFNSVAGLINPDAFEVPKTVLTSFDTDSLNNANDTGYGFHAGWLYEFTPCTRLGISYHSQVVHHFSGKSKFVGPIANTFNNDEPIISRRATTNVKLPPYTAVSFFNKPSPQWALMGTVTYTQWNTFKTLALKGAAGLENDPLTLVAPSTTIEIDIPENYQNSWNVSLGANYYPTDTIIIRTGIGYDKTPVRNAYRNVQLPDGDRYAISLGAHFQATKTIGLDAGWAHIFFGGVRVNPPPQVFGAETISTNGRVSGGADVLSGQVTWDIV
jgi:long-chain fatty acid transport protein